MPSVLVVGERSKIGFELSNIMERDKEWIVSTSLNKSNNFLAFDRYLFCSGYLTNKRGQEKTPEEVKASYEINYSKIANVLNHIIHYNAFARICVIGSESAYRGSYDDDYARNKKYLHDYIINKKLKYPEQQLVGISPSIIEDAGMTTRRTDIDNLENRRQSHRMKRFITSREVAELAYHLLFHQPYISGTIIRMHGENDVS